MTYFITLVIVIRLKFWTTTTILLCWNCNTVIYWTLFCQYHICLETYRYLLKIITFLLLFLFIDNNICPVVHSVEYKQHNTHKLNYHRMKSRNGGWYINNKNLYPITKFLIKMLCEYTSCIDRHTRRYIFEFKADYY